MNATNFCWCGWGRLAVCVTLASLQAAVAFNPSAVAPLVFTHLPLSFVRAYLQCIFWRLGVCVGVCVSVCVGVCGVCVCGAEAEAGMHVLQDRFGPLHAEWRSYASPLAAGYYGRLYFVGKRAACGGQGHCQERRQARFRRRGLFPCLPPFLLPRLLTPQRILPSSLHFFLSMPAFLPLSRFPYRSRSLSSCPSRSLARLHTHTHYASFVYIAPHPASLGWIRSKLTTNTVALLLNKKN